MAEYYFDIETVPLEQYRGEEKAGTDPSKSKIVTIQYQRLDGSTGQALGDLKILKEWESDEKTIVTQFAHLYLNGNIWDFVPVGNNLAFESRFMKHKLKQYHNLDGLRLGHRPMIDLKHVLVIANNGSFKGYSRLLGKSGIARNIEPWYYDHNYEAILEYVRNEIDDFVRMYSILKRELPKMVEVLSNV